jgi:hypothetical protein
MAAVLHLLHAINRYMQTLASGGWSMSGELQITNWQYHSILQFTA